MSACDPQILHDELRRLGNSLYKAERAIEGSVLRIQRRLAGHQYDEPYDVGYKQGLKDALIDIGESCREGMGK